MNLQGGAWLWGDDFGGWAEMEQAARCVICAASPQHLRPPRLDILLVLGVGSSAPMDVVLSVLIISIPHSFPPSPASDSVEHAFNTSQASVTYQIQQRRRVASYTVVFAQMIQVNTATGYERAMRRGLGKRRREEREGGSVEVLHLMLLLKQGRADETCAASLLTPASWLSVCGGSTPRPRAHQPVELAGCRGRLADDGPGPLCLPRHDARVSAVSAVLRLW
jgi:hypothetical protein